MKSRTRGRELALQFLYQVDLRGASAVSERDLFLREEEKDKEARKFAQARIEGVLESKPELDRTIQEVAQNWDISRMAVIRSPSKNMCSVRHSPIPTAPNPRAFRASRGVSAFARTRRSRTSSAQSINSAYER